jgi:hypothetical protein
MPPRGGRGGGGGHHHHHHGGGGGFRGGGGFAPWYAGYSPWASYPTTSELIYVVEKDQEELDEESGEFRLKKNKKAKKTSPSSTSGLGDTGLLGGGTATFLGGLLVGWFLWGRKKRGRR